MRDTACACVRAPVCAYSRAYLILCVRASALVRVCMCLCVRACVVVVACLLDEREPLHPCFRLPSVMPMMRFLKKSSELARAETSPALPTI